MPMPPPNPSESSRLWRLSGMGSELAFGVIGMALLGFLLDRWMKSTPWIMLVGALLGLIGGGYNFIRRALAENKAAAEQWREDHPGGMAAIKAAQRAKKGRGAARGGDASGGEGQRGSGRGSPSDPQSPERSRGVADGEDDPYR